MQLVDFRLIHSQQAAKDFNEYFEDLCSSLGDIGERLSLLMDSQTLALNTKHLSTAMCRVFTEFLHFTATVRKAIEPSRSNNRKYTAHHGKRGSNTNDRPAFKSSSLRILSTSAWKDVKSDSKRHTEAINRACDAAERATRFGVDMQVIKKHEMIEQQLGMYWMNPPN